MPRYGDGIWKEGRHGAASLCYVEIGDETLAWVAEHHARVGIRATLASHGTPPLGSLLAGRNWELTASPPPGHALPAGSADAQTAIAACAQTGAWRVWLIDAASLAACGVAGHSQLLGWLGSQHARIWCAPVRDIAAFRAGQPPADSSSAPL